MADDLLEDLWTNVIHRGLDRAGLTRLVRKLKKDTDHPFSHAGLAVKRILATAVDPNDLCRLARYERYQICFQILYDAGEYELGRSDLRQIRQSLIKTASKPSDKLANNKYVNDLRKQVLHSRLPKIYLKRLMDEAKQHPNGPFADVGPAIQRIFDAKASRDDLVAFAQQQQYQTCLDALQLIAKHWTNDVAEACLYESILGAEPTGSDARPGSWPLTSGNLPGKGKQTSGKKADGPLIRLGNSFDVAFSPDGKYLASIRSVPQIWDLNAGEVVVKCDVFPNTGLMTYSPNGKLLACVNTSGKIAICDAKTGKAIHKLPGIGDEGTRPYFSPNGRQLMIGDRESLLVLNVATGKTSCQIDGLRFLEDLSFLSDDELVLWTHESGEDQNQHFLSFWSWPLEKRHRKRIPLDAQGLGGECWPLPRTKRIVVTRSDDVAIIDPRTGKSIISFTIESPRAVAVSPNGIWIAVVNDEGAVLLDAKTMIEKGHRKIEYGQTVAFSPDSKMLAVGAWGKGEVWDVKQFLAENPPRERPEEQLPHEGDTPESPVYLKLGVSNEILFLSDGKHLITSERATWNLNTKKEIKKRDGLSNIVLSPDGKLIAGFGHKSAHVFDMPNGDAVQHIDGLKGDPAFLLFSPDCMQILVATHSHKNEKGVVLVCEVATGSIQQKLDFDYASVHFGGVFLGTNTLVIHSGDLFVCAWPLPKRRPRRVRLGKTSADVCLPTKKKGTLFVAGHNKVALIDIKNGKTIKHCNIEGGGHVKSAAMTNDGKWIAVAVSEWDGEDSIQLFNGQRFTHKLTIAMKEASAVAFSHDGHYLAAGSFDVGYVWELKRLLARK